MNYELRFLEENEYHLTNSYFDGEETPRLDPRFSRVLGAFSSEGDLIGFVCLQLVAHAEPIFVKPEHRQTGIGLTLTQEMDSYCHALGLPGLYIQPTNLAAEKLASAVGFQPAAHALWEKIYGETFQSLIAGQREGD